MLVIDSCDIRSNSGVGIGVEGAMLQVLDSSIHDCERHGVAAYGGFEGAQQFHGSNSTARASGAQLLTPPLSGPGAAHRCFMPGCNVSKSKHPSCILMCWHQLPPMPHHTPTPRRPRPLLHAGLQRQRQQGERRGGARRRQRGAALKHGHWQRGVWRRAAGELTWGLTGCGSCRGQVAMRVLRLKAVARQPS